LSCGFPCAMRFFRQAHFMLRTANIMASDEPTVDVPVPSVGECSDSKTLRPMSNVWAKTLQPLEIEPHAPIDLPPLLLPLSR
jgi:hypothetical protein